MGYTKRTQRWQYFLCSLALMSLVACGGADIPYLVDIPHAPQSTNLNPEASGGDSNSNLQGCAIPFQSQLILEAKGGGDLAEIKSDPQSLQAIPLRFGSAQVAIFAQEFPSIDLVIDTAPAAMRIRQKEGSSAQGAYDVASGKVEISNLIFVLTLLDKTSLEPIGIEPIEMPALTLTTASIDQAGSFGSIQKQGVPLDASTKSFTLVGGLAMPSDFPSEDLQGAALVVSFSGTLSDLPAAGNCSDNLSSGVQFKVVSEGENGEIENDLTDNILSFGRVYVPQTGIDSVIADDTRFISKRKLRVKNASDAEIKTALQSSENFKISPQGEINILAGASKDFQIEFSMPSQADYSEPSVPSSKEVKKDLSFGDVALHLHGEAKRAAAELAVIGTEENAPSTLDMGLIPAAVLGSGADAKLNCSPLPGRKVPIVSKQIILENHGIRPLSISKIQNAVDLQAQVKDPFCGGFPTEFNRVALSQEGTAQCQTQVSNGKTYILDQCKLPDSNGRLSFKVVYFPVNASSIRNQEEGKPLPDAGSLSVLSDDPRYDVSKGKESFKLNLLAGVSPDQSDVLRIAKVNSQTQVSSGGNIRVNISNNTDESVTQKLVLLNYLDQALNEIQIRVENPQFEIEGAPLQIPAMPADGNEPAKSEFSVKFKKTAGMDSGDVPARLQVKFRSQGGSENTFEINLIGSVNHKVLTGNVQLKVDFISSFFDSNLLRSAPIDSDDFRSGRFEAFRPGSLDLFFSEVPGQEHLRSVKIQQKLNFDPFSPQLLDKILNLTIEDRKQFFRVYSTRLSGYPGGVEDGNQDGIPDCVEPQSLRSPFQPAHCSFFYYIFSTKPGQDGIYNDETGELFFPDIKLNLFNPYHATVLDYDSNLLTSTELKASISTMVFDGLQAGSLPLVPEPRFSSGDIAVPDDVMKKLQESADQRCPNNWVPWDESKTPVFSCFVRPSSPHYLRGFPARPLPNGDQSIVLSLVTQFPSSGSAENIPSFMANARKWVAIMGRLSQRAP